MHVSRTLGLSLAALGLAAGLGTGQPADAQVLTAGAPTTVSTAAPQPSAFALSQIAALQAEKAGRTPAQAKIDSNLLRAALLARASQPVLTAAPARAGRAAAAVGAGTLSAATLNLLATIPVSDEAQPDANGMVSVDIEATVTDDLLARIAAVGGTVSGSWPAYDSVRASLPVLQLETVAASGDVRSIRPAAQAHVVRNRVTPPAAGAGHSGSFLPGLPLFAPAPAVLPTAATPTERRARVKAALPALLDHVRRAQGAGRNAGEFSSQSAADFPLFSLAAQVLPPASTADPQGDLAQRAALARTTYGVTGNGIKIGVISDSVDGLAAEQSAGRLGPVTVLPGQSGTPGSGEGTAMLEIVNRLAPGAQLYFATANPSDAQFATNIQALQQAGCNIIVDDVGYYDEPPFQDGPIAQAVDIVSAAGAFYFSSAGNDFNLDQNNPSISYSLTAVSGGPGPTHNVTAAWEGDWAPSGTALPLATPTGANSKNDIGAPTLAFDASNHYQNQVLTAPGYSREYAYLFWANPQGGATDDYDIVVLNSTATKVMYSSTNIQSGTQDPIESCQARQGNLVTIVKASGNGVLLHLFVTSDGAAALNYSTPSNTLGHACATSCYGVAAADASIPYGQNRAFQSTDVTEYFSSDGPRRVFFNASGTEYTPGNRSSTGGQLRQKPVLTGSDGVSAYPPNFTPFYGTSAAAPHDAAIAGLMLSADPFLKAQPAQMFSLLTGSDLPIDTAYGALPNRDAGYGILDAYTAVGNAVAADTPTATAQSLTTTQGAPVAVTLAGSDPNNQALTYTILSGPAHGTLAGTAPNLTYTPSAGYAGPDSVTFTVSNGTFTSAPATVSVTVITLSSLTFTSPVPGGTVLTATVTLSAVATSDVVVGTGSSDPSIVRINRGVIVHTGSQSATFAINTFRSHVTQSVTITATLGQVVQSQNLTITGR